MREVTFCEMFNAAIGREPYDYQSRLAWECEVPDLLSVPTSSGKTAAAILAWVYRRRFSPDEMRAATPRRLVFALPLRTIADQTASEAAKWLNRLESAYPLLMSPRINVYVVLGGEADDNWVYEPDRDSIIIGSQDMLLSRALNRGFGSSRFRWPQLMGLLNSDAQWIFDEIQLMGAGLATAVQLDAFRRRFGAFGITHSMYMSATSDSSWLATVDHPAPPQGKVMTLSDRDLDNPEMRRRMNAAKTIRRLDAGGDLSAGEVKPSRAAREAIARVAPSRRVLVMLNKVERAQEVYRDILKALKEMPHVPDVVLLHSRYRPIDRIGPRQRATAEQVPEHGQIVVSTQVVEAGVNFSAHTLITDLAPWASMVQRLGRCNRLGYEGDAEVLWMDVSEAKSAPYTPEQLASARLVLDCLEGRVLTPSTTPPTHDKPRYDHVIRAVDLMGLFDTTPDLAGQTTDPARFIRDANDMDVSVFWRDIDTDRPLLADEALPGRDELCAVPVYAFREFIKARGAQGWIWDHLAGRWAAVRAQAIVPGLVIMLAAGSGGYSEEMGWDARSGARVSPVDPGVTERPEAIESDSLTRRAWRTIAQHTDDVCCELEMLLDSLGPALPPRCRCALRAATRTHDSGKCHPVFVDTMKRSAGGSGRVADAASGTYWAKAPDNIRHSRKGFRHELASALAVLRNPGAISSIVDLADLDLVAYLVASHHGRVRLAIRSLPGNGAPPEANRRHALGVWDGEELPEVDLGGGLRFPGTVMDMSVMDIGLSTTGEPSWISRMTALRDLPELGPFRLAYLEAIVRAADARGSGPETDVGGDQA